MKERILLLIGAALWLAGCAIVVPEPTPMMAGGDEAVYARLQEGRRLYIDKCSGCHSLKPVTGFSDVKWRDEVDKMRRLKKVKLRPEDRGSLLLYLTTVNGRD